MLLTPIEYLEYGAVDFTDLYGQKYAMSKVLRNNS